MTKYQRKPQIVKAFQMTMPSYLNKSEWPKWLRNHFDNADNKALISPMIYINGEKLFWDEWIILKENECFTKMDNATFQRTYEPSEPFVTIPDNFTPDETGYPFGNVNGEK